MEEIDQTNDNSSMKTNPILSKDDCLPNFSVILFVFHDGLSSLEEEHLWSFDKCAESWWIDSDH